MVDMSELKTFKQTVAEVKLAYDIVDYIQQSGINLTRHGHSWKGLCPFHNERTPSFHVNENFQNYRCFGCGENGDILMFVQKKENRDFYEALSSLAEDKGIDLPTTNQDTDGYDYKSLKACIKSAANFFYAQFKKLPENHLAKKEITDRGLTLNKMLYGYAPESRQALYNHLKGQGFSDETILGTRVCGKSEKTGAFYDFWQGRLMFFITDATGKPTGFSGRKLFETDKRGKYVNSMEGPLFDKGASLYNIAKARETASKENTMFVVEGQFDVGAYVEADVQNVVASSGTAFKSKQGMIIRRIVGETGKIIFAFDGDEAGLEAAVKVFKNVPEIHDQSYVVSFPDKQDPCDYRLKNGSEALVSYTNENSMTMIEFILESIAVKYDLTSDLERSQYVKEAVRAIKTISSATLRESFLKKVALRAFVSLESVREMLESAKPMELANNETVALEENVDNVKERPSLEDELNDVDEDEIIKLIRSNAVYNASARLIAISFMEKRFIPYLIKSRSVIPEQLASIIDDLNDLNIENNLVPEQFKLAKVIDMVFSANFFPSAHLMAPEDNKEQFKHLRNYLRNKENNISKNNVRANISRLLEGSTDVDFLISALEQEEKELNKLIIE